MFKENGNSIESFTPLIARREKIWRVVLHVHNILYPPYPKIDIMGPDPHCWCKFHKVKGHQTDDYYHFKKEIKCFIQKGHQERYVKGSSSRWPSKHNSHGLNSLSSLGSKKGKDPSKGGDDNYVPHTLNTITILFTKGEVTNFACKRYALEILVLSDSHNESKADESESLEADITFSKKDAIDIHTHNDDHVVIIN